MRVLTIATVVSLLTCDDNANQLVVTFDTDAIVSSGLGDALDDATPLFDTLRVDVLVNGAVCSGCSRSFSVTRDMFALRQVSIGVPLQQSPTVLRARLYLARLAVSNEPPEDATIDRLVALPSASSNPGQAGVLLPTALVGHPNVTPDALDVQPESSAVGTWPQAQRVGCDSSSSGALPRPARALCVRGGAYWMGTTDGTSVGSRSADWHRLAVLSPFYLDATEVTVGAFRAAGLVPLYLNNQGNQLQQFCTFTSAVGPYESLPVTCVTPQQARAFCNKLRGDLPTGTQYEFVATQYGRTPYVWGYDQPTCTSAVFDECHVVGCTSTNGSPTSCFPTWQKQTLLQANGINLGGPVAAIPACTQPSPSCLFRDALPVDGGEVVDLVGNVSELTSDAPFDESDPCYSPSILTDPACPFTTTVQIRGGSSNVLSPLDLRGEAVDVLPGGGVGITLGFRCAYPATPAQ